MRSRGASLVLALLSGATACACPPAGHGRDRGVTTEVRPAVLEFYGGMGELFKRPPTAPEPRPLRESDLEDSPSPEGKHAEAKRKRRRVL